MTSHAGYTCTSAGSPRSPPCSPASRLRAATGTRANPEERPLPGSTSLNQDYRSPSRSPSTKLLAGSSPGTPTRRATTRLKEASSLEDLREQAQATTTVSRSSAIASCAPRPLFMPTPRRGANKPIPSAALAQIQDSTLAFSHPDVSINHVGYAGYPSSMERYNHSPAKLLTSSLAANTEPNYSQSSDGFSPAKKALRASMMPPPASTTQSTRGKSGPENAPQRILRSTASRPNLAAPGTPSSQLAPRFGVSAESTAATPSYRDAPDRESAMSGRTSPVRQVEAASRPRAKVTEGVGSRLRSAKKVNGRLPPASAAMSSPEKRGLGISMGLLGSSQSQQQPERQRSRDGPLSPRSLDLEKELEDSSFVYADPEDPEGEALGLSALSGEGGVDERQESVMVHVRLRPPKQSEKCAWIPNTLNGSLSLEPGLASQRVQQGAAGPFSFDGLLTGSANRPVYISVARPLIRSALDGYDAVVFAYGQTASGKTFTLSGDERGEEQGIIPRAVRDIFRGIKQSSARREYLLRASYLEIWNENVKDLLEPSNVPQVRDDRRRGGKGTFVHPLREEIVTSPGQVRELLSRGQANRHVGATDWNERSSRSHTCFKMTIESWERDTDLLGVFEGGEGAHPSAAAATTDAASRLGKKVRVSELCLIDLAGSEKYVSQGSDRRAEGAHINKSLLTLGKVIFALSEKTAKASAAIGGGVNSSAAAAAAATAHVPYRDSKLTRILQNSLSGHARVAVVCTINPNPSAVDESLSTLNFAKRVKKVSLHARRNEIEGDASGLGGAETQALIMRYRDEAVALRKKVAELQSGAATPRIDDDRIRQLQDRLDVIGSLVVRGGGVADEHHQDDDSDDNDQHHYFSGGKSNSHSNERPARPVSPLRKQQQRTFAFSDPPHILQEKLYNATTRIASLQRKLASRPSLPAECSSEADKDALIGQLRQQVRELEMVCEAQAADAPPKIREDVEREWRGKTMALEEKLKDREKFVEEMSRELERLRRANKQLIRLAHNETASMVSQLQSSPHRKPHPFSRLHPSGYGAGGGGGSARPVSVLGGSEMEAWREAYANSAAPSPAMTRESKCQTPTVGAQSHNNDGGFLRAPNRFRPRRSVSHDGGLLVERELAEIL